MFQNGRQSVFIVNEQGNTAVVEDVCGPRIAGQHRLQDAPMVNTVNAGAPRYRPLIGYLNRQSGMAPNTTDVT